MGGGVRDLLLGKKPKDFDIATNATPEDVRRLFRTVTGLSLATGCVSDDGVCRPSRLRQKCATRLKI